MTKQLPIELPDDETSIQIVPMTDWLYAIRQYGRQFEPWHKKLYKNKNQQFRIYTWGQSLDEKITPLDSDETATYWELIYKIFHAATNIDSVHLDEVRIALDMANDDYSVYPAMLKKTAEVGDVYLNLYDVFEFSNNSGIPNPYIKKPRYKLYGKRNELSAVIEAAIKKALDPDDHLSVFATMINMALEPNPHPPLVGVTEGGELQIKYRSKNTSRIEHFTCDNLKDCFMRQDARKGSPKLAKHKS